MKQSAAKILKPELSINKKLGNIKFEQAFDELAINNAEMTVVKSEGAFKAETANDYARLRSVFAGLAEENIDREVYRKISELAFSIKARAAIGGLPLASEIANSMYKFSDAAMISLPKKGVIVLKLHFDALAQVFDGKFEVHDEVIGEKLVRGLEEVVRRFLYNE